MEVLFLAHLFGLFTNGQLPFCNVFVYRPRNGSKDKQLTVVRTKILLS